MNKLQVAVLAVLGAAVIAGAALGGYAVGSGQAPSADEARDVHDRELQFARDRAALAAMHAARVKGLRAGKSAGHESGATDGGREGREAGSEDAASAPDPTETALADSRESATAPCEVQLENGQCMTQEQYEAALPSCPPGSVPKGEYPSIAQCVPEALVGDCIPGYTDDGNGGCVPIGRSGG